MKTNWYLWGTLVVCGLVAGCTGSQDPDASAPAETGANADVGASDTTPAADAAAGDEVAGQDGQSDVALQILNWEQTQELIKSHQGKVVVVDLWSTTCTPCMREFPHLVELHKKYKDQVVCISVSTDYYGAADEPPESFRDRVLKFLESQGATFHNVLLNIPSDEFFAKIDLASIPAVYVYNPQGEVEKRFDNDDIGFDEEGFTYQNDIVPLIESLLSKN